MHLLNPSIKSGVYAGNNTWHRGVRQIYSEFAWDGVAADYTQYALSLETEKFEELAKDYEIEIPTYVFSAEKNGQNSEGDDNGEYTIIATE